MQPATQAPMSGERTGRGDTDRGQPVRRSAGGEMHRVLIRIPDFRDPAPIPTSQPITTLPLSQEPQTFIVHQAHTAFQPHIGQNGRGKATPNHSTIIAAPPTGEIPVVNRVVDHHSQISTAAIDAVVGADADEYEDDIDEQEEAVREERRAARKSHAKSKLHTVGRWVSELDADDVKKIGRKLSVIVTVWQWMQSPRILLTALGALLVQMTGLAVLLEMQGSPSVMPPGPKSSLAPSTVSQPAFPQTLPDPMPTPAPPRNNPLPEGPLTPSIAPPRPAQPIVTPANSSTVGPKLDQQEQLPWETTAPSPERPTQTPLVPDASAARNGSAASVGARPVTRKTHLLPQIELPSKESPR